MERRSCNDRLKPPPVRGSVSVAVDSSLPHGPTRDVRRPGSGKRNISGSRDFRAESNPAASATIRGTALATPSSLLRQLP
jgi:hypothetical protein